LPALVFEAALCISWRDFRKDLPVVAFLATVGVLLTAAVTAAGMRYALDWDWGSATVFGVLIAATHCMSVLGTFNSGLRAILLAEQQVHWLLVASARARRPVAAKNFASLCDDE
jgi:NhaP-type Na+/H+ or K+/H+ antiporter